MLRENFPRRHRIKCYLPSIIVTGYSSQNRGDNNITMVNLILAIEALALFGLASRYINLIGSAF